MKKVELEDIDEHGRTALHCAVELRDVKFVETLLKAGADCEARRRFHGDTPLTFACRHGKDQVAKFLISFGANVNGAYGHPVVDKTSPGQRLLKGFRRASTSKAEPAVEPEPFNAEQEDMATPLLLAAKLGNHEIVDNLM